MRAGPAPRLSSSTKRRRQSLQLSCPHASEFSLFFRLPSLRSVLICGPQATLARRRPRERPHSLLHCCTDQPRHLDAPSSARFEVHRSPTATRSHGIALTSPSKQHRPHTRCHHLVVLAQTSLALYRSSRHWCGRPHCARLRHRSIDTVAGHKASLEWESLHASMEQRVVQGETLRLYRE